MTAAELREMLRRTQEEQGFFFSRNEELVTELLEGLIVNKGRYGYMCCPCRLATGDREKDRDIICPCAYRTADVAEYGTCYCGLYVAEEWNTEERELPVVPERRPAEKRPF